MSDSKAVLMISFIWLAPHAEETVGLVLGIVFALTAIAFYSQEKRR